MSFNKVKIFLCYFVIAVTIVIYVVSQTLLYSFYSEHENMKYEISKKEDTYNKMMVKINTVNSREKIISENPQLQVRDNIYYLESYE